MAAKSVRNADRRGIASTVGALSNKTRDMPLNHVFGVIPRKTSHRSAVGTIKQTITTIGYGAFKYRQTSLRFCVIASFMLGVSCHHGVAYRSGSTGRKTTAVELVFVFYVVVPSYPASIGTAISVEGRSRSTFDVVGDTIQQHSLSARSCASHQSSPTNHAAAGAADPAGL